jgi:hypothetical protein
MRESIERYDCTRADQWKWGRRVALAIPGLHHRIDYPKQTITKRRLVREKSYLILFENPHTKLSTPRKAKKNFGATESPRGSLLTPAHRAKQVGAALSSSLPRFQF